MKFHVCSKEFDSGHKGKNFCLEQCVHHEEEAEGDTGVGIPSIHSPRFFHVLGKSTFVKTLRSSSLHWKEWFEGSYWKLS